MSDRQNIQLNLTGVSPTATGIDCVLAVFELPANTLDIEHRTVDILAQGTFSGSGYSGDVQIVFNPSTAVVGDAVGSGGVVLQGQGGLTHPAGQWAIQACVTKVGAPDADTQIGFITQPVFYTGEFGSTGDAYGMAAPQELAADESEPILIAITGSLNGGGVNLSDLLWTFLKITVR